MKIIIKTIDTIKDNRRQKKTIEYKKKSNRLCTVLFLEIIILKLDKKKSLESIGLVPIFPAFCFSCIPFLVSVLFVAYLEMLKKTRTNISY